MLTLAILLQSLAGNPAAQYALVVALACAVAMDAARMA